MLTSFPSVHFPVTIDAFEAKCPEWLDENYYGEDSIMMAVCARMMNRRKKPVQHIERLNSVYHGIMALPKGETGRFMVADMTVIVFRRDCCNSPDSEYELVMYGA